MLNTSLIATLAFLTTFPALAQSGSALPFKTGEKQSYTFKWKFGPVAVRAGTADFEIANIDAASGKMTIVGSGDPVGVARKACKCGYKLTSTVNLSKFASEQFALNGTEDGKPKNLVEKFDYVNSNGSLTWQKVENGKLVNDPSRQPVNYKLTAYVQDALSAFYAVRAMNLPKSPGSETRMTVVFSGDVYQATLRYAGEDSIKVHGERVDALRYKVAYSDGKKENNKSTSIWISDDEKRTLLKIESHLDFGKIVAQVGAEDFEE